MCGLIRMELVTHQYHIRLGQIVEKSGSSYCDSVLLWHLDDCRMLHAIVSCQIMCITIMLQIRAHDCGCGEILSPPLYFYISKSHTYSATACT